MDLKDFVTQTLTQIIEGVIQSQANAKAHHALINPHLSHTSGKAADFGFLYTTEGSAQFVKFDVALTVTAGSGTKGGIGVFAGAVNLGSSGESNASNSSVSRVQFTVPLVLPEQSGQV